MKRYPEARLTKIVVSEAGASVYSASELAAKEFPDLDVSIRGAVSIARRLQDPLAELVKIEPKSIGVGQYQHDVSQTKLRITSYNVCYTKLLRPSPPRPAAPPPSPTRSATPSPSRRLRIYVHPQPRKT